MVLHEDSIGQTFLLPLNLMDFIPENHICFYIERLVNQYDFCDLHSEYVDTPGNKAYSRKMLARIVIMGQIDSIRSGRKLAKAVEENVVYMYLSGMQRPKYRTLINFKNDNKELMAELLAISVREARRVGMVSLNYVALDGTTIKSNASSQNTLDLEYLEIANQMIKEAEELDELEDKKYGDKRGDEAVKKFNLKAKTKKFVNQNKEDEDECLENKNKDTDDVEIHASDFTTEERAKLNEALIEGNKIKEQRAKSTDKKTREKKVNVSLTDPHSPWMKNKKGKKELSYNIQHIVDCDNGIILNATIMQDQTDHYQLPIQLEQLKEVLNADLTKSKILADAGYNTQDALEYLHDNDFDAYIPSRAQASADKNKEVKKFSKANFNRNYEKDCFTCPEDQELPFKKEYETDGKYKKVYYTNKCKNCPSKSQCTPKSNYRIITVYTNKYQDAMEIKLNIPENKEEYKKRIVVERTFAHMKHNLDFTQVNTREMDKLESEVKCIATAANIRQLHNNELKLLKEKRKQNATST